MAAEDAAPDCRRESLHAGINKPIGNIRTDFWFGYARLASPSALVCSTHRLKGTPDRSLRSLQLCCRASHMVSDRKVGRPASGDRSQAAHLRVLREAFRADKASLTARERLLAAALPSHAAYRVCAL